MANCKTCIHKDVCKYADKIFKALDEIKIPEGWTISPATYLNEIVDRVVGAVGEDCKYYKEGGE